MPTLGAAVREVLLHQISEQVGLFGKAADHPVHGPGQPHRAGVEPRLGGVDQLRHQLGVGFCEVVDDCGQCAGRRSALADTGFDACDRFRFQLVDTLAGHASLVCDLVQCRRPIGDAQTAQQKVAVTVNADIVDRLQDERTQVGVERLDLVDGGLRRRIGAGGAGFGFRAGQCGRPAGVAGPPVWVRVRGERGHVAAQH